MANQLKMAISDSIFTLHQRGWSQRRIARELGLDRETVARYLRQGQGSKPAIAPIGSTVSESSSKPANAPIGSEATETVAKAPPSIGRPSDCEPHRVAILSWLGQGLSAQRICQDLVQDHGFAGSYYSVRRFVRRFEHASPLPMRRLEVGPGEEMQVDFGRGAAIVTTEGRRRPHVFRLVLSHSRKG